MRARLCFVAGLCAVALSGSSEAIEVMSVREKFEVEAQRRREAPPILVVTPMRLAASFGLGKGANLKLEIGNGGGQTLKWSVASAPYWAQPTHRSGEISPKGKQVIWVSINRWLTKSVTEKLVIEAAGVQGSPASVLLDIEVEKADAPPDELSRSKPEPARSGVRPSGFDRRTNRSGEARRAIGVRAGMAMTIAESSATYDPGPMVGVSYRRARSRDSAVSYEIGVDAAQLSESTGNSSSTVYTGRLALLIGPSQGKSSSMYLVSGLGVLGEAVTSTSGSTEVFNVGLFDLGAGMVMMDGRVDLRVAYGMLIGSENATGVGSVTIGMAF